MITLVIIGIIAAITVPTLMNKTNNQEYVSRLKKAYSTLAQATNLIIAEEGTPKASVGGWASSSENIYNMYKKHLNNAKDCGSGMGCFYNGTYTLLNSNPDSVNFDTETTRRRLVLSDGSTIVFNQPAGNMAECSLELEVHGFKNACANLYVDINGAKKPNTWGKDLFEFVIKENGLKPAGCDYEEDKCVKTEAGYTCACKVLREGAINY